MLAMGADAIGAQPKGLTLSEAFTRTFDVFPYEQPTFAGSSQTQTMGASFPKRSGATTGSTYGFGSATLRFQNEMYGSHLSYGKANKAVIELSDSIEARVVPGTVNTLAAVAPSRDLPDYASNFKCEPGHTFAKTVSRDAPPGEDGKPRFWVQPKDTGGLFPDGNGVPAPFIMEAPRGAGPPTQRHHAPTQLLTPAERREALVFDKCHERARATLRKAQQDACNLTYTMQKRYPHGVMGLEGPGCPDSIIYKAERERREVKAIKDFNNAVTRFENLAERRDTQLDYQLLTHDSHSTAVDKMFTHKASSALGIRGEPTISDPSSSYNLRPSENGIRDLPFRSNQEQRLREMNPARTERLHNIGTRGKPYDIISGVALPVRPTAADSTMFEHDRRAHPSNLAVPHEGVFGGFSTTARTRGFTAPTLSGPIPDAHQSTWQPPSPTRAGSKVYMS
ncbi:hypothetical protein Ctob_004641 [Chrysochromulina tobinii]|uniref:Uncharacterized protein n=1 Tax=Chrysochromulina tobinii TaxID=1460289 RepID=A0A0M0JJL9_9EUKA|nr:hypothetical protein Ctob_004641 [Chrysochromulina tobinii]|eukprot:KOO26438.1 hypothetical protein Ctob_004641 [Chrysochromulina sp. CCMP291]